MQQQATEIGKTSERIDFFIGCPSDAEGERDFACDEIDGLKKLKIYDKYDLRAHTFRDVPPGTGATTAQQRIVEFLGLKDQIDFFIFILGARMGTPYPDSETSTAFPSATAYEFFLANEKLKLEPQNEKKTQIMLYHITDLQYSSDSNDEQQKQVEEFLADVKQNQQHVLLYSFERADFQTGFRQHIHNVLYEYEHRSSIVQEDEPSPDKTGNIPTRSRNRNIEYVDAEETPKHETASHESTSSLAQLAHLSDELLTFAEWRRSFEVTNLLFEFQTDNTREQFTNQFKDAVLDQVNNTFQILHGSHGVGKTRFAMEAIRAAEVEAYTLYVSSPLALPHNFFRQLPEALEELVLVVDNCDAKAVSLLKQQSLIHEYPILLLAISSDPVFFSEIDNPEVFRIPPIHSEARSRFWRQLAPEFDFNEELHWKLELEIGGNLKLAAAVARELSSGETFIGLSQIVQRQQVRLLLESYIESEEERSVLQALSLLGRISMHSKAANEGEAIARFVDISHSRFQLITERLTRKRLVHVVEHPQEGYRVAIPLLAILLAEEAWQAWGPERIVQELIVAKGGLPNKYVKARLIGQLARLGRQDLANKAVGNILWSEDDGI